MRWKGREKEEKRMREGSEGRGIKEERRRMKGRGRQVL